MIRKKTLTPILLAGIFCLMLGLSFAAVPLYDLFCRVTGFGGTTQVSKEPPKMVLDKVVSVRFDTNVNNLTWDFYNGCCAECRRTTPPPTDLSYTFMGHAP